MSEQANITTREESLPAKTSHVPVATPLVDIYENDNEILLNADMPGVTKENITIHIDNGKLDIAGLRTITAEGATSWEEFENLEYQRTFSVPQSIDISKVDAELKDGVLKLHLPKSEAAKPRTIAIQGA